MDFAKDNSPLIAANGTIEVFAADNKVVASTTTNTASQNAGSALNFGILLVGAVIIGLVVGVILGKIRK